MLFRSITLAGLAIALSACTTSTGSAPSFTQKSPVETRWVGQSAGIFFAKFGPPLSDTETGSSTIYNWRGGYKKATVPARSKMARTARRVARFRPPAPPRSPARFSSPSPATTRSLRYARFPTAPASTARAIARNSSPQTEFSSSRQNEPRPALTGGPFRFFAIILIFPEFFSHGPAQPDPPSAANAELTAFSRYSRLRHFQPFESTV